VEIDEDAGAAGGARPLLAIWKLASCDGCQLSILALEDELLTFAKVVKIAHFTEISKADLGGPYDLSLVEGSVSTPRDELLVEEIRQISKRLIAIGACATAGGIQALRNYASAGEYSRSVYEHPEYLSFSDLSTPVSAHVKVDLELHGCPIDRYQLLEVVTAELVGRRPVLPTYSVCQECKARGTVCLLVSKQEYCLGPVTRAGCGAICPSNGRGCYGCFGPQQAANPSSLSRRFIEDGASRVHLMHLFHTFNAAAPPFSTEGLRYRDLEVVDGDQSIEVEDQSIEVEDHDS